MEINKITTENDENEKLIKRYIELHNENIAQREELKALRKKPSAAAIQHAINMYSIALDACPYCEHNAKVVRPEDCKGCCFYYPSKFKAALND